ncbi:MAG: hypothetical protein KKB21_00910 [Nanoarchaeota archaeon]|nr:hypothetical protein [Nanoarchaeota archaeon]MBU4086116.1 hypothetical protein [Nanoarchaeota archaeon]
MKDRYHLIEENLIPLSKYWSVRLGFLDILNNTKLFLPIIENREDIGDDLKTMIKISKEWKDKNEHNVGEAGALFRLLQFASWKFNLGKEFIKERTLKDRKICDNPDIVNFSINNLLKLDNNTPQWASAKILIGSNEEIPDDFFLSLSKEALTHYNESKEKNNLCELRFDETILNQAEAFLDLLKTGKINFLPIHQDDYCFARVFDLIDKEEGERRWLELKGHESNRLEEMEKQIKNLNENKGIDSRDHRVVQAIAMLSLLKNKNAKFTFPECVSKSWPQFWDFLKYVERFIN